MYSISHIYSHIDISSYTRSIHRTNHIVDIGDDGIINEERKDGPEVDGGKKERELYGGNCGKKEREVYTKDMMRGI